MTNGYSSLQPVHQAVKNMGQPYEQTTMKRPATLVAQHSVDSGIDVNSPEMGFNTNPFVVSPDNLVLSLPPKAKRAAMRG